MDGVRAQWVDASRRPPSVTRLRVHTVLAPLRCRSPLPVGFTECSPDERRGARSALRGGALKRVRMIREEAATFVRLPRTELLGVETGVSEALCRVYSCMPLQPNAWYPPQSRREAGDTLGGYDLGCVVTLELS